MGQITRAYKADGTLRFDALSAMRQKHPKELWELSWSNVYDRPDLQLRTIVLQLQDDYKIYSKVTDTDNALAFTDAAYNGGAGGLDTERRACKISGSCDPKVWFGNVEKYCMKSKVPLYGPRSACDINRDHVRDVLINRAPKYKSLFQ